MIANPPRIHMMVDNGSETCAICRVLFIVFYFVDQIVDENISQIIERERGTRTPPVRFVRRTEGGKTAAVFLTAASQSAQCHERTLTQARFWLYTCTLGNEIECDKADLFINRYT